MLGNNNIRMISPQVRRVKGYLEIINNGVLVEQIGHNTNLKSLTIERVGEEGKFFGFGICQKLNTHLIKSANPITTATKIRTVIYDEEIVSDLFPFFYVTEVNRDENSGELSVTAYDAIYKAAEYTISEVNTTVTTIKQFAQDIAAFLGCNGANFDSVGVDDACFAAVYNETALANYEGTETIRSVLDDIAEATQTVYYINNYNSLVFKRLDKNGKPVLTISKDDYITLDSGANRRLTNLVSTTELGDNLKATLKAKASGATITVDDVSENAHTVEVTVTSKNIFDINTSRLGDLTNISAWAGIVLNADEVREIFKPNKVYTAQFIAEGLANINYASVYDAHIGFMLHCRNPVKTVSMAGIYRSGTSAEQILTQGKTVEAKGTFITPDDLDINDYELLIYTQRCLDTSDTPVINTIKFSNIQIEEGVATSYTPYIAPEAVTVSVAGADGSAATYTPEASGIVGGVASVAPTMTVTTNSARALISIKYEKANVISGTTQYIRNNPFWDLRADRAQLVDDALTAVWGMTINQFDCVWRGNPQLEIGDKIALVTKDNETVISYVLNDVIDYSGGLTQRTSWHYTESEETASNPSNLGELLTQTYAKVDKVNKRIEMVVSSTEGNTETINQLISDKDGIVASVEKVEKRITDELAPITSDIADLTKSVEAQITAEDVQLKINSSLESGVNKVTTSTGYTFNDEGLTVEKSGSEMKTTISDDGMRVYRNNHEVLTADNKGVKAENLHATTYLIIGGNSRFEDYGGRTGCFWIG